jgi:hypothetical protein
MLLGRAYDTERTDYLAERLSANRRSGARPLSADRYELALVLTTSWQGTLDELYAVTLELRPDATGAVL